MQTKKKFGLALSALLAVSMLSGMTACSSTPIDAEYPSDPGFDSRSLVYWNTLNPEMWNLDCAHDPVIVEDNGTFYVFGTDNYGPFGYQIRKSTDLINWEYVGVAIPEFGDSNTVLAKGEAGESPLQEVYDYLAESSKFDCATLWAPEVYPAADGGYWLYGSWTTTFGSYRSIIFQCHADSVTGPYEYVDMIVFSNNELMDAGLGGINAIDAAVVEDPDGGLWLSYGSFSTGFAMIELDPETGLRKDGYTYDMIVNGEITADQYVGEHYMEIRNTEGSTLSYHADVPVYTGNIATEEYDESKWTTQSSYYLMGSNGSLSENYNMRVWKSEAVNGGYTSLNGLNGNKVSGSFSWREKAGQASIRYDYFCPGHNDMITTSAGVNLIVYHNRVTMNDASKHYLFLSMYDFNSNGDLVISPNRYAGESVRTVDPAEITGLTKGEYDMVKLKTTVLNNSGEATPVWCTEGVKFKKNGTISGAVSGSWKMYGDHYIYLEIDGAKYYGSVMPAWIEKNGGNGGLTISALSEEGTAIYFNMAFEKE